MTPNDRWTDQYNRSVNDLGDVVKLRNGESTTPGRHCRRSTGSLLFAGGFVTLLYVALSYAAAGMHALAVGLMATMVGLVIFLLLEVNHPFRGEIAVTRTTSRTP